MNDKVDKPSEPNNLPYDKNYKFKAPIEDPELVKHVMERLWDIQIPVSIRELALVAPEFRKATRKAVTGKHVLPMGESHIGLTVDSEDEEDEDQYNVNGAPAICAESLVNGNLRIQEAVSLASLQSIAASVNGKTFECTLDSGAQFVAMSSALWYALKVPLDPDCKVDVVSSNGTINQSLGLC